MQYGDDGRPFDISGLLDEIDFRDQRTGSGAPNAQKVFCLSYVLMAYLNMVVLGCFLAGRSPEGLEKT